MTAQGRRPRTHRNINKLASDHFNNVRLSAGTATKKRTIVRKTNCFLPSGVGRTATGGTLTFFPLPYRLIEALQAWKQATVMLVGYSFRVLVRWLVSMKHNRRLATVPSHRLIEVPRGKKHTRKTKYMPACIK
jgi:hypothetical protein